MNLNGLNWAPSFPTTCTSQKRIQHIKWQILNWKLEFFRKWEALPLGVPWIFSKITATFLPTKTYKAWHATKQNQVYQVSMRLSSTGNNLQKKEEQKSKGGRILFDKTWISEQTYHWNIPHVSSPDYKKPLQLLKYGLAMFGYSIMKPPKTFSMPSNISKRGFCFKKALPCQAKTRATSKWGVLCIDGPAKVCMSIHTQWEQASARRHLAKLV